MKRIIGMPLTMLVIGLLMVGGVSAALVAYLSNPVTATTTVDLPLELKVKNVDQVNWHDDTSLGALRGGGSATLYIRERNYGNNDIVADIVFVINEVGVDNVCEEIASLMFTDPAANDGAGWDFELKPSCSVRNNGESDELFFNPFPDQTIVAGHDKEYSVVVTFAQNAVGTYTATIQHV